MRRKISIGELKNGIKVYVQYDSGKSARLWGIGVKAGSIHDPRGKKGMAHLAEHVMCAESREFSNKEIDLIFEKFTDGPEGNINICTDKTSTYFGPLNSLNYERHMKFLFGVMADMIKDRVITPDNLAAEKAAVHNEHYLRGEDWTELMPHDLIHRAIYKTNPASLPIDGNMKDVCSITLNDVKSFVRRYYVPANIFLIFLGPSFKQAMELAKEHFEDWNPYVPKNIVGFDKKIYETDIFPIMKKVSSIEIQKSGIHQHHVTIGFPTDTYLHKDAEGLDVLARLLSHRIKRILRDNNTKWHQGTYRALGFTERTFMHGVIYFSFATIDKDFAKYGEDIIIKECERIKTELVSTTEIDAFVTSLYYQQMDIFQTYVAEMANAIIRAVSNGDENLIRMHERGKMIKNITRTKLRNIANKYLTKNYARAIIHPA